MAVPYTFGSATTSIPLSQLDSNFATAITLGNTAVQLGNTITSLTGVSNVASATSLSLGSNGNTTAVTIDTSQNVLVGTTSLYGGEKLAMLQSTNNRGFVIQQTNASNTNTPFLIDCSRNTTNNTFNAIGYYNSGAGAYKFQVADSGSIATAGSVGLGTSTPPNNGIGIAFPATQSASSDANTLDDYEEGTWTPSYTLGSGSVSGVTSSGTYVKIGKQVSITLIITFGTATAATVDNITGLPFTSENTSQLAVGALRENANTGFMWQLRPNANGTGAVIRRYDNTNVLVSGFTFVGTVTYFTT